uniref:MSTP127 n=1 Tax=Homo sapiens TaxID=9606 RepID=R4GRG0_HUMAN|nr:MSTP127 [Homo sapiens]
MSPSSEGSREVRPVGQPIGGVSAIAQVRSGSPRGAGWGPRADLSLLAPLSSNVQKCWRTSVHIPRLGSCQQWSYCRGMSQACFPISVKLFETLLCLCFVCACV